MNKNDAILEVIIERFEKQRLPRLFDIKAQLDQGNKLSRYDLEFLEEVLKDTQHNEHYVKNSDEEAQLIFMKAVSLYKEITQKAIYNESKTM